ncbi:MAG: phosphoribosylamine--glycine ligase, partial [Terriglobia bacterium]
MLNVLVIGGGGREHALAWKLAQSPRARKVYCAPGNGGIGRDAECVPADVTDVAGLARLAEKLGVELTVVGPELPLALGVADEFARRGLRVVGPRKAAAEIEASKVFAKKFMRRHAIPTASFTVCETPGDAYSALCSYEYPVVIKADGLAGGKGTLIGDSPDESTAILERLMEKRELGTAGDRVVLEEYLEGEEVSFIVLTDGTAIVPLAASQDHKRAFDNDEGPNTGGMGAYSDDNILGGELRGQILREIVEPTVRGLAAEGRAYQGFLYFGLMLTSEGPRLLEFNARMGDPEAQPLVLRLESDLLGLLDKVAKGELGGVEVGWSREAAVCVVLASRGYPGHYETGKAIAGLEDAEAVPGVKVFHAGTQRRAGPVAVGSGPGGAGVATAGGRVLGVTARGADLRVARERAYQAVSKISFEGMHYRRDIGARG